MSFDGEYFQQIFGVIMGTNVAPILANIYENGWTIKVPLAIFYGFGVVAYR